MTQPWDRDLIIILASADQEQASVTDVSLSSKLSLHLIVDRSIIARNQLTTGARAGFPNWTLIKVALQGGEVNVLRKAAGLEGWIARQAQSVAIIAEGFRQHLEAMGVASDRIHHTPNWTYIGGPTLTQKEARVSLGLPLDKRICLHAGNMGLKQSLENVVEAARLAVIEAPELFFVLLGGGSQRQMLEQLGTGLPNLSFMDPVSDDMFPNALFAGDVLLINQRASVKDMSLPSKFTSYRAVGRPIIAAVNEQYETARVVDQSSNGKVVEANNPSALLGAIYKMDPDQRIIPEYLAVDSATARCNLAYLSMAVGGCGTGAAATQDREGLWALDKKDDSLGG